MISRRDLLLGAATAAAAFATRPRSVSATASQPKTSVAFDVPPGACDCHTHVFGEPTLFPFAAGRTYTPEPASVSELRALHRALRTTRVVIVQPSVYGTDNACTLDALKQIGPAARGVAVIDERTPESTLDAMAQAGVRGIRVNLLTAGVIDPGAARQRFQFAADRAKRRRWHVQIYASVGVIDAIKDVLHASPVPVVFDHFGGIQAGRGVQQNGFSTVVSLVRSGKAYVKMSAPYLASTQQPGYEDVAPFARALVEANPRYLLWATNWPHPSAAGTRPVAEISPLRTVDDGQVFNLFPAWVPDAAQRRMILVENPARLYGF